MSAVRFAIGSRPGLSEGDAGYLAKLLVGDRRNVAASHLAGRIRAEAGLDPDRRPVSKDIGLSSEELRQISDVFAEVEGLLEIPAFAHLNDEVLAALRGD